MKKAFLPLLALVLTCACGNMAGFQDSLADAMELQKKFNAGNCNVTTTMSTDGNALTLTFTNITGGPYAELDLNRFATCAAYEYAQLKPDSVLRMYRGVTIAVGTEEKNGILTTSSSQSAFVTYEEMVAMDSLYELCSAFFAEAYAQQSFAKTKFGRDTIALPDSLMMAVDSVAAPFFSNKIASQTFFGFLDAEEVACVWMRVEDDQQHNVYRFVFNKETRLVVGLGIND